MAIDIKVPNLGESVSEATISKWFKKAGDAVAQDEPLCELETDKVTQELPSPKAGVLKEIKVPQGKTVEIGAVIAVLEEGAAGAKSAPAPAPARVEAPPPASAPVAPSSQQPGPAARKLLDEHPQVSAANIGGSGKDGRVTKGDVLQAIAAPASAVPVHAPRASAGPREERVKMTKLRQTIAKRLKDSQNTAAILTTFNEIDMTNVMALRNEYKDAFEKKHGVKFGFMSIFTKAAVNALRELPAVNASIEGDELVYKNYYDIGIAVGTENGLVVPVVRDADHKSLAEIEADIGVLAEKARKGTLSVAEMTGGTFTITNGGVYGSLMATPIINPPQSGILGMHKVEKRPVVVNDQIVIRPMMYVALSYDHRIIDGRESVTFLVRVKEAIEDPRRLLLGV